MWNGDGVVSGVTGGDIYWGKKEAHGFKGIVVLFAWVSVQKAQLNQFVDLYYSLGWNSLICYAHYMTAFHSERAMPLAFYVLHELVEELRTRPCPVVFVALSAGPQACMYKVIQLLGGNYDGQLFQAEFGLLRNSVAGHIYDSGPVDVISDFGIQFVLRQTGLKMTGPSKLVSWLAKCVASSSDALYLTRLESIYTEYEQALFASANLGAPFLFICSQKDNLAPYLSICAFAQRLQDLGGDVQLQELNGSFHVDHYRHHPEQYKVSVKKFLEKATLIYSRKIQICRQSDTECLQDEISELICELQKAAVVSNQSLTRPAPGPGDQFLSGSSAGHDKSMESGPMQNEQKETHTLNADPPCINAHGVLGQILFDVCVPKNVEGWDVKMSKSLKARQFVSGPRHSHFSGVKCIRRSKL